MDPAQAALDSITDFLLGLSHRFRIEGRFLVHRDKLVLAVRYMDSEDWCHTEFTAADLADKQASFEKIAQELANFRQFFRARNSHDAKSAH